MIKCNLCDVKVKNTFQGKWNHVVRHHPEVVLQKLMPIIENDPFKLGEMLGRAMQERLKDAR